MGQDMCGQECYVTTTSNSQIRKINCKRLLNISAVRWSLSLTGVVLHDQVLIMISDISWIELNRDLHTFAYAQTPIFNGNSKRSEKNIQIF